MPRRHFHGDIPADSLVEYVTGELWHGETRVNEWLNWHLDARTGPKRILALDGGGVRGLITLGMLEHIEKLLASRNADPGSFRLAHYFDLIGGTSTGSIIATALALGMTVSEVKTLYEELSPIAFKPRARGIFRSVFDARHVEKKLLAVLGEEQLQSDKLLTGLMICAKRIDTGSPWVLTNHPKSKYWESPDKRYMPNKEYLLRMLVRASTAAPLYYDPVEVTITPAGGVYEEQKGLFIDGAVGGHNNPGPQALHVVTLPAYGFGWNRGADNLLMISLGTGAWRPQHDVAEFQSKYNWQKATDALAAMIQDSVVQGITVMQALSNPRKPWTINSEIGDMRGEMIVDQPVLRYQRYDARLDAECVARVCNLKDAASSNVKAMLEQLRQIGNVEKPNLQRLYALGHDAGHVKRPGADGVEALDFPAQFDPPFMKQTAAG